MIFSFMMKKFCLNWSNLNFQNQQEVTFSGYDKLMSHENLGITAVDCFSHVRRKSIILNRIELSSISLEFP